MKRRPKVGSIVKFADFLGRLVEYKGKEAGIIDGNIFVWVPADKIIAVSAIAIRRLA